MFGGQCSITYIKHNFSYKFQLLQYIFMKHMLQLPHTIFSYEFSWLNALKG